MFGSSHAGLLKCQARSGQAVSDMCRYNMAQNRLVNTIWVTLCVLSIISGLHIKIFVWLGNCYEFELCTLIQLCCLYIDQYLWFVQ